jgi:hypothetical protein
MDSEAGVFAMAFDLSGTRLITAEADKTIKLYREDDTAVSIFLSISWIEHRFCLTFKSITKFNFVLIISVLQN